MPQKGSSVERRHFDLLPKLAFVGKLFIIALDLLFVVMTANLYLSGWDFTQRFFNFLITFVPCAVVLVFILVFWKKPLVIAVFAFVLAIGFSIITLGLNDYPESLYGLLLEVVPLLFAAIVHFLFFKETRNKVK